eukprot:gene40337-49157_t
MVFAPLVSLTSKEAVRRARFISAIRVQHSKTKSTRLHETSSGSECSDDFEIVAASSSSSQSNLPAPVKDSKRANTLLAFLSVCVGGLYAVFGGNVNGLSILQQMEKESVPVEVALCNNKPTIIEFYADWCESCKRLAPSMRALELRHEKDVNFITLDALRAENAALLSRFRVDGIPHLAFLSARNGVLASL